MKITFVLPFAGLQGGVRVVAGYADRLARRGHAVTVISTPLSVSIRSRVKSLILGKGLNHAQEPSYFGGGNVEHRVLDQDRPVLDPDVPDGDVVVATFYTTAYGVQGLSAAKGAKAIFIQGYEVEPGKHNPRLDATWRMPLHKIAVSTWLVQLAREKFGDETVSLVPNGVDPGQFHAAPRGKGPVPTVGLVHSNTPLKGSAMAIKALSYVAAAMPSLRIVSFGTERPALGLRLPRGAVFHCRPLQEKLRELYAQCDVWLCGSQSEGFGLPLVEAMACRCPVVSTRCGGPIDIVEDGRNGHLTHIGDAAAFADRVLRVLSLPTEQWRQMSDAAHATALRFTWERAVDLFEGALQLAIERSRQREPGSTRSGRNTYQPSPAPMFPSPANTEA